MAYVIGLQLPAELKEKIISFKEQLGIPVQEPFIKLISAKYMENETNPLPKMGEFCNTQESFKVVVSEPKCYENCKLYLAVVPGHINIAQSRACGFFKINQEGKVYRPHVTLIKSGLKCSKEPCHVLDEARGVFGEPFSFTAQSITLFDVDKLTGDVTVVSSVPLTGR